MVSWQVLHCARVCSEESLSVFKIFFDLNDYDSGAGNICKDPSIG